MEADNDVHDFSKEDKYTKVGKFLRKTSLDELPQLISIAKAKMSFIGPRPWISDYYDNMNDVQRYRYCIRPGLTGLAQVKGRNEITIFEKIKYDLEYIENYSFKQDIKVMLFTIKTVFKAKGTNVGKLTIKNELEALQKQENISETVAKKYNVNKEKVYDSSKEFCNENNLDTSKIISPAQEIACRRLKEKNIEILLYLFQSIIDKENDKSINHFIEKEIGYAKQMKDH